MQKRAISPLIATLILIAITIVGGVVVYRLFFSSSGAISSNVHVTISDVSLSAAGGLALTMKNDGNVAIASYKVTVTDSSGSVLIDPRSKVQEAQNANTASSTITCTFASNVASGNLLIVAFSTESTGSTVSSVTDGRSTTYTQRTTRSTSGATNNQIGWIYTGATPSAGPDTITVTFSASSTANNIDCLEFSGAADNMTRSATGAGTTSGIISASVSAFTPTAGELVFAYVAYTDCGGQGAVTYDSSYTSGSGTGITGTTGSNCATGGGPARKYTNGQADEWASISSATAATFSITQSNATTTGSSGWLEMVIEMAATTPSTTTTTVPGGIVTGAAFVFTASFAGANAGGMYNIRLTVTAVDGSSYVTSLNVVAGP